MSKRHTITTEDSLRVIRWDGFGFEFSREIASSAGSGSQKSLSLRGEFNIQQGQIVGASICFRVIDHGRVVAETDDVQTAIDAYNGAR